MSMTPEEAIKLLGLATKPRVTKEIELSVAPDVTDKFLEAVDMAISALQAQESKHSNESSLTQKALDTISRRVAIDTLDKHLRMTDVPVSYPGIISALTEWLNELPSAQPDLFVDADKLKRCRFEYINACKTLHNRTPDTRQQDIYDAYAVIKALQPIFGEETFA